MISSAARAYAPFCALAAVLILNQEVFMDNEIHEYVLSLLKNYAAVERQISILRYELEHPAHVSADDMIESMSFGHGDGTGKSPGHISNKTLYIALNYQERAEQANGKTVDEIATKLFELERERDRRLHFASLLTPKQQAAIRLAFFEQKTSDEMADCMGISVRTAKTLKKQAVLDLCKIYAFAETHL